MAESVVVLGGGFGGITAAIELTRLAGDLVDVTLVDREPEFAMGLTKLWVAAGKRTPAESMRPRDKLKGHGIDFRLAEVQAIDTDARTVATTAGELGFDRLVIALGLSPDAGGVEGLSDHGLNLYTMSGAMKVSEALEDAQGEILVAICAVPFKCPPAPYEAAMMIDARLRERGAEFHIEVATPEPRPMPILPPEAGERVVALLAERGIAFSPQHRLVGVEAGLGHFENGAERRFDLLIAVPPHRAPALLRDVPGLTDDSGMIPVDRETLATSTPAVYAVGDVAKAMSYTDLPIPRAGILAEGQGRVVAANIAAELRGEPADVAFDGKGYCFVEVGGGRALRAEGEFYAQPAPLAHFAPEPSEEGFAAKVAFETDRLVEWFGG